MTFKKAVNTAIVTACRHHQSVFSFSNKNNNIIIHTGKKKSLRNQQRMAIKCSLILPRER
jgi:hypothetical protein